MAKSTTRLVFIYTGKVSSGMQYTQFTSADFAKLSHATGFVVCPSGSYSVNGTDFTNYIASLKQQVQAIPSDKSFYIGLPPINASDSYAYTDAEYQRFKSFITTIAAYYKSDSRFKGFNFTNERVFGTVSTSSPTSNAMVKLMNNLAYVIRNDPNAAIYKEFIWAPYLGYNSTYYTINQNLGIVANRTNIFNTIYLQPTYYYIPARNEWNASTRTGVPTQNLDLAYKCVSANAMYNYSANNDAFVIASSPVGGSKTSSTKIAIDMEAEDSLKWSQNVYGTYYNQQCGKMKPLFTNGTCPFLFYAGSYNGIISAGLHASIQAFYKDGSCQLP